MKNSKKDKIDDYCIGEPEEKWTRVGNLIVDLCSLEKGYREMKKQMEKHREEIWDYLKYRESLIMWPSSECGLGQLLDSHRKE